MTNDKHHPAQPWHFHDFGTSTQVSRLTYLQWQCSCYFHWVITQTWQWRKDLGEIRDDLSALDASVVVFVNQQRLNDNEDLVDVRAHEVVQLVQNAVDDFHQQMTLLVLQRRRHQKRQYLVEQRVGTELTGFVGDLPKCRLKTTIHKNALRNTRQHSGVG